MLVNQNYEQMAVMLPEALKLNCQVCRDYVKSKFSVVQMVDGYEAAYQQLLESRFALKGRLQAPKLTL